MNTEAIPKGRDTYGALSGKHDDLVMAVAMACGSRGPVVGTGHARNCSRLMAQASSRPRPPWVWCSAARGAALVKALLKLRLLVLRKALETLSISKRKRAA